MTDFGPNGIPGLNGIDPGRSVNGTDPPNQAVVDRALWVLDHGQDRGGGDGVGLFIVVALLAASVVLAACLAAICGSLP